MKQKNTFIVAVCFVAIVVGAFFVYALFVRPHTNTSESQQVMPTAQEKANILDQLSATNDASNSVTVTQKAQTLENLGPSGSTQSAPQSSQQDEDSKAARQKILDSLNSH